MLEKVWLSRLALLTGHLPPRSCVGLQKTVKKKPVAPQRRVSGGRNLDVGQIQVISGAFPAPGVIFNQIHQRG